MLLTVSSLSQAAQQTPARGARPVPSADMLAVCATRTSGADCAATDSRGISISGTCLAPPGRPLACRPADQPAGGTFPAGDQDRGESLPTPHNVEPGTVIESTRANTDRVLCGLTSRGTNPTLGIASTVTWTCTAEFRQLIANGIPGHAIGAFPNAGNPNRVSPQSVDASIPLNPVKTTRATPLGGPQGTVAFALNGVKFDPGTGGSCATSVTSPRQCDLGAGRDPWRIEALGQSTFDFGVDGNNAHVQPDGAYHYHGLPTGLMRQANISGREMQLIGWASDGFPVYSKFGRSDAMNAASALRVMNPSFRMKANPDAGRPAISLIPMGAFGQDYEYVAGLGDLDECNGRFDVTPEFPKGIYHYYATDAYPYVQRCVKGQPQVHPVQRGPRGGPGRSDS